MTDAYCGNPDCATTLDRRGVPHEDREKGFIVLLCPDCARYVRQERDSRWRAIDVGKGDESEHRES